MFQPAHILSSVFILRISSVVYLSIPYNFETALLSIVFHMLPDLDIFWAKKINSHRITYWHAPLFWITIFIVLEIINFFYSLLPSWILPLFIIQVIFHLVFDFITARTGGIPILFPFIKKEYSLFSLNKTQGNFYPLSFKGWWQFLKFYFKNKLQVTFELSLCLLGILAILF
jgi:hypothetical protein